VPSQLSVIKQEVKFSLKLKGILNIMNRINLNKNQVAIALNVAKNNNFKMKGGEK